MTGVLRRIIITMHEFLIHYRLSVKNTNIRTEQKHIVFLSQLLLLFNFFHTCKADNHTVVTSENGTQAIVRTHCNDPKCNKEDIWYSQPQMPGVKIPAGNYLLSLSIILGGGSATKVFKIFSHMGLGCVSLNTHLKYQRVSSKYTQNLGLQAALNVFFF